MGNRQLNCWGGGSIEHAGAAPFVAVVMTHSLLATQQHPWQTMICPITRRLMSSIFEALRVANATRQAG
jgi:hypothetical protein